MSEKAEKSGSERSSVTRTDVFVLLIKESLKAAGWLLIGVAVASQTVRAVEHEHQQMVLECVGTLKALAEQQRALTKQCICISPEALPRVRAK